MSATRAITVIERVCDVAAAAAHDLNEELTVILSSVSVALDELGDDDDLRPMLLGLQAAAQRSAFRNRILLNFARYNGARGSYATIEHAIDVGLRRVAL